MKRVFLGILVLFAICAIAVLAYLVGQSQTPIVKTQVVTLQIQPSPSFNLSVDPASILTFPDRVVAYNATVTAVNNFAGEIVFSVEGLPTGVTATFFPSNTLTLGLDPKSVQITVSVGASAPVGTYSLTIKATSTTYN